MNEKQIQYEIIRKCGSLPNVRLFRNTVGVGFVGTPGSMTKLRFGLHPGSGDLIGWKSLVVDESMIGSKLAQFVSIEVKGPHGRTASNQLNWYEQVMNSGGLALIANDVNLVLEALT